MLNLIISVPDHFFFSFYIVISVTRQALLSIKFIFSDSNPVFRYVHTITTVFFMLQWPLFDIKEVILQTAAW